MPRKNARPKARKARAKLQARVEAQRKVKVMDKHPRTARKGFFAALFQFLVLHSGAR